MSENLPKNNSPEDIDLVIIFNLIGKAINNFFKFILTILKFLFSNFIYALKPIINNIKIIVIALVIAAGIGYGLEKTKQDVYSSRMIVRPYFDSKYQLVTNINYYNALLEDKDYDKLEEIFGVSEEDAKQILSFEINPGPETENYKLLLYDKFVKTIDSVNAQKLDYEDFIENRSIYNGDVFEIEVMSFKKDIFRSLENGLNSTFANTYSVKKMQKRDSLIALQKQRIINSLKEVDSLKKVYINVITTESKSDEASPLVTKDGVSLIQERTNTREFDLLEKQITLRQELSNLEAKLVEEDVFFDTISSFQDVGTKYIEFTSKYTLVFPILILSLFVLGYLALKFFKFVKDYE